MRGVCLLCCCALVVLTMSLSPGVAAIPSFLGYTGLIIVPTADVLSQGEWNAGLFTFEFDEGPDADAFCANLGVAPTVEVGFTKLQLDDSEEIAVVDDGDDFVIVRRGDTEGTFLNGKCQFMPETATRPAVAAGIIDLTDEMETTVYVVGSKSFGQSCRTAFGEITSPRFHVGIGGGLLDSIFGGVSASLGDRLFLMAEYDGNNVNAGARFSITDEWHLHLAGMDWFDNVGIGVSFSKGF
jgi:hypothetical protein